MATQALTGLISRAAVFASISLILTTPAFAHPEDEFCTADSGLDPALCAALAEVDRPATASTAKTNGMLDEAQRTRVRSSIELDRPWWRTAGLYLKLGIEHIVPKGLDHILFVLALFLASTRLKPLVLQISAFTLAHTITLGLASAGWVNVPGSIVEPLIAISIAFVAIENMVFKTVSVWRLPIVFCFGLFHGLGFASVLLGLGLPDNQFLTALVGFNIGVELGQLFIILTAWILLHHWFTRPWYRTRIVMPVSLLIAMTACWWAVQRTILA